jgi:hypothetical protein
MGTRKKTCVIYANCQGSGIELFLNKHDVYKDTFVTYTLENHILISQQIPMPIDLLKEASLFIYQPVGEKHGCYATNHLKSCLPKDCQCISFPYIYNSALWPLFEENQFIIGEEIIRELFEKGVSLKSVVDLFCEERIDFQFEQRFQRSLAILKQKEQETDVNISDFITRNIKTEKLFLTQSHPTSVVFIHCVNQILERLGLTSLPESLPCHPNEANLPDCWPSSPYEKKFYRYTYQNDWRLFYKKRVDSNWHRFHIRIIRKIYLRKRAFAAKRLLVSLYLKLRISVNMARGQGYLDGL